MSRQTYADMLRDPRWQRKRLEIMERDDFSCRECGDKTTTLNVHHTYYAKGRKPWEYEDESLKTLCQPCHERITEDLTAIQRAIGMMSQPDYQRLIGYIAGLQALDRWPAPGQATPPELRVQAWHEIALYGVADALGLPYDVAFEVRAADGTLGMEEWSAGLRRVHADRALVATTRAAEAI